MHSRLRRLLNRSAAAAALALLPFLLAGGFTAPSFAADDPPQPVVAVPHLLDRVALIGASVTAGYMGFGIEPELDLGDALEAAILDRRGKTLSEGDYLFFMQPGPVGRAQVEKALSHKPTLVVAVDFLFWYGFGTLDAEGKPLAKEEDRLGLLEKGLELLARFEVPVVVGDFPDVREAVGRVLRPQQVPTEETRAKLNARLREWAAKQKRVRVVPLDEALAAMRKGGKLELCGAELDVARSERWLQEDRLHVTLDGMVVLVQMIGEALRQGGAELGKDVWLCDFEALRKKLAGD